MPSNRFNTRLSMAMPDTMLTALGKLNVPAEPRAAARQGRHRSGAAAHLDRPSLRSEAHGARAVSRRRRAPHRGRLERGNERAPAWSSNLKANPDARIEIRGARCAARARVAEGEERAELWTRLNDLYDGFGSYDARTSRDIAVFVLEPR